MASSLRYQPHAEDVIIPWNADYEYPSVANKAIKISPRITPTSGTGAVLPGQTIKFTFPAQGFLDCKKTTLSFDLYLKGYNDYSFGGVATFNTGSYSYLQNNVSSIFKHVKISYGSYQFEQTQENGFLQRQLSEFSGYGAEDYDHQMIAKGLGGTSGSGLDFINVRAANHSLINDPLNTEATERIKIFPSYVTVNGGHYAVRRYQVELPFGVMQQGKLLPIKYMASQLTFELTLAGAQEIIMANPNADQNATPDTTGTPDYYIQNVVLHPELLEFDQSYEMKFIRGLETGGVPLQFSTFKTYVHPLLSSNMSIPINERSRSVKAIFAFIRKQAYAFNEDSGASFGDFDNNVLESFQYRVGGRYFPASPCMNTLISGKRTGSVEPYIELQKALKTLGDPSLISAINAERWNRPVKEHGLGPASSGYPLNTAAGDGKITYGSIDLNGFGTGELSVFPAEKGVRHLSGVFCMATSLETSNGRELSGLNAEEQSDINLMIKFQTTPPTGYEVVVYTLVDKVMIVKENNYVDINE